MYLIELNSYDYHKQSGRNPISIQFRCFSHSTLFYYCLPKKRSSVGRSLKNRVLI